MHWRSEQPARQAAARSRDDEADRPRASSRRPLLRATREAPAPAPRDEGTQTGGAVDWAGYQPGDVFGYVLHGTAGFEGVECPPSFAGLAAREAGAAPADVAAAGLAGPSRSLPHLAAIQASFGHHDVSTIRAHVGGPAAGAAHALGAVAYATGDSVAFADTPDLHTAAHEAAHVIQARPGVHRRAMADASDDACERHADAVADLVVAGRSAAALLDRAPAAGRRVQRKPMALVADPPPARDDSFTRQDDQKLSDGRLLAAATHAADALQSIRHGAPTDTGVAASIAIAAAARVADHLELATAARPESAEKHLPWCRALAVRARELGLDKDPAVQRLAAVLARLGGDSDPVTVGEVDLGRAPKMPDLSRRKLVSRSLDKAAHEIRTRLDRFRDKTGGKTPELTRVMNRAATAALPLLRAAETDLLAIKAQDNDDLRATIEEATSQVVRLHGRSVYDDIVPTHLFDTVAAIGRIRATVGLSPAEWRSRRDPVEDGDREAIHRNILFLLSQLGRVRKDGVTAFKEAQKAEDPPSLLKAILAAVVETALVAATGGIAAAVAHEVRRALRARAIPDLTAEAIAKGIGDGIKHVGLKEACELVQAANGSSEALEVYLSATRKQVELAQTECVKSYTKQQEDLDRAPHPNQQVDSLREGLERAVVEAEIVQRDASLDGWCAYLARANHGSEPQEFDPREPESGLVEGEFFAFVELKTTPATVLHACIEGLSSTAQSLVARRTIGSLAMPIRLVARHGVDYLFQIGRTADGKVWINDFSKEGREWLWRRGGRWDESPPDKPDISALPSEGARMLDGARAIFEHDLAGVVIGEIDVRG